MIQVPTPESITMRAGRFWAEPPDEDGSRRRGSYPFALQWGTLHRVREIRWTSESEAHIARHGVTPEEVEQAIIKPRYETSGREDSTLL